MKHARGAIPATYEEKVDYGERSESWSGKPVDASVVIVTYGVACEAFDETIAALDAQTDAGIEVIVVDNGTNWSVSDVPSNDDYRSRYVALERNYGVTLARNLGVDLADSDLLLFLDLLRLESAASVVFTDSGGEQDKARVMGTPCVTLLANTERPETLFVNSNVLVGTDPEEILDGGWQMVGTDGDWETPYGDGNTSERILRQLRVEKSQSARDAAI